MKTSFLVALAASSVWTSAIAQAPSPPAPFLLAAVGDAARPARDRFRDDRRKPSETMTFAGVAPGERIAELIPGNGYYTRLLAKAVGPTGKVYTLPFGEPRIAASRALAADPAYGNIVLVAASPANLSRIAEGRQRLARVIPFTDG
jgi:predicted methyltransferase